MQSADFVVPRKRKTCLLTPPQHGGARSGVGLLRSLHCSLRSLAGASCRCLPHSLADEKHVGLLVRPGQRRASLAQRGSHCAVRRLRRPSQTKNVSARSASARRRAIRDWICFALYIARSARWLALHAAAFLTRLQRKDVSARSFVQGSDAPALLSADRAMESADFVVPRRRKTCLGHSPSAPQRAIRT